MSKKLYDEEVINKVYKAIEIHLKIIEESNIYLGNTYEKKRIEESIDHLEQSLILLRPPEDELKKLKKDAFFKYKKAKIDLAIYEKNNNIDAEVFEDLKKKVDLYLKLYLAYKG